jgi:predicted GNAT family acetyltransferase
MAHQSVTHPPGMAGDGSEARIEHQPDQHRFVAITPAGGGEIVYEQGDGVMTIVHTQVDPALEGEGVAGRLVQAALDHARAENMKVEPVCPYASKYMDRHPESKSLRAD